MRIISLLLCVILCVSLALTSCGSNAEQVSSGEESNVVSETEISSVITDESLNEKSASEVSAPADPEQTETAAKLYNVRDYGAKGNGDADDSAPKATATPTIRRLYRRRSTTRRKRAAPYGYRPENTT